MSTAEETYFVQTLCCSSSGLSPQALDKRLAIQSPEALLECRQKFVDGGVERLFCRTAPVSAAAGAESRDRAGDGAARQPAVDPACKSAHGLRQFRRIGNLSKQLQDFDGALGAGKPELMEVILRERHDDGVVLCLRGRRRACLTRSSLTSFQKRYPPARLRQRNPRLVRVRQA